MDELHVGKVSVFEKEARELMEKVKAKGVIIIVIEGNREGADHYEVASVIKGDPLEMMKLPYMLMALADKFMRDIKNLIRPENRN